MFASDRPLSEQIDVLKAKIALLEGDRKAYYEYSQWTLKENRETILQLRKEVSDMRKKLQDSLTADDHVINKAFEDKPVERAYMKNKTGRAAIGLMSDKLGDTRKRLDQLQHTTVQKQKRLEELQIMYHGKVLEHEQAVQVDESAKSETGQILRSLENRMDKALLKCNEAEHIRRTYEQIKAKLEEDSIHYPNTLNKMESDRKKCKAELRELQSMCRDAELCKETALVDLKTHEEILYNERKKRETELMKTKKEAEEKKLQHERIERRLQRTGSLHEETTMKEEGQVGETEDTAKIQTYEDAMKTIKEATGVSETSEVVQRFASQGDTRAHLEELKDQHEKAIARLREEKEELQQQFEEMKYTGEAKLSSGQRLLEEFEQHVSEAETKCSDMKQKLEHNSDILVKVKAGVEHLSEKVSHIKATKSHVPAVQISSTSDEYILDVLSVCEEKLIKVTEALAGKDIDGIKKQIEHDEFQSNLETKLPTYNTRVKLPQTHRDLVYDDPSANSTSSLSKYSEDDDDSGDEAGGEVLTRQAIKKNAQVMVDTKTKRGKAQKGKSKK